jgi:hypothetical protein
MHTKDDEVLSGVSTKLLDMVILAAHELHPSEMQAVLRNVRSGSTIGLVGDGESP